MIDSCHDAFLVEPGQVIKIDTDIEIRCAIVNILIIDDAVLVPFLDQGQTVTAVKLNPVLRLPVFIFPLGLLRQGAFLIVWLEVLIDPVQNPSTSSPWISARPVPAFVRTGPAGGRRAGWLFSWRESL